MLREAWVRLRGPWSMAALALLIGAPAFAQVPPRLLPNLELWGSGSVLALLRQPDGGLVVGGSFTQVDGRPRLNLARFRPDGTLDESWVADANRRVESLAAGPDGTIYVQGDFDQIAGQVRRTIARLRADGSIDAAWNIRFRLAADRIESIAVDGTGRLYVGGFFSDVLTPAGVVPRRHLARFDAQGNLDASWTVRVDDLVQAIALSPDGARLWVGGVFRRVDQTERANLAALTTSGPGVDDPAWRGSASSAVNLLVSDTTGALYVGGDFATLSGVQRLQFGRFLPDGRIDTGFIPRAGGRVRAVLPMADGDVLVGGEFLGMGGGPNRFLARLDATGAHDPSFDGRARAAVQSLLALGDGSVAVGGTYDGIAGSLAPASLSVLDASGTLLRGHEVEGQGRVAAIAPSGNGLVIGGAFRRIGAARRGGLARIDAQGALDPAWRADTDGTVAVLAQDASGRTYASGSFQSVAGQPRAHLVRLLGDGSVDPGFTVDASGPLSTLYVGPSGMLYAYGNVAQIGGQERRVARIGTDGVIDVGWAPTINGPVLAFHETPGVAVVIGGQFNGVGGENRFNLVRVDAGGAKVDPLWRPNPNRVVTLLRPLDDGSLLVGGDFSQINGAATPRFARIDPAGSGATLPGWTAPGATAAPTVTAVSGRWLYADQVRRRLLRFDLATGVLDAGWTASTDLDIRALAASVDGRTLFVAGDFLVIGGQPRPAFAGLDTDVAFASGFE